MIHILRLILTQMVLSLRSRAELQVENLALRHQIEILKRTAPMRARPTKTDRMIFTWLLRVSATAPSGLTIAGHLFPYTGHATPGHKVTLSN